MRVAISLISVVMPAAAWAEVAVSYPMPVPQECVELAVREGVPTLIENKYQAIKAQYKLARLSGKDPLVQGCRAAVARAKAAAKAASANNRRP
jgi:hypothetical protein